MPPFCQVSDAVVFLKGQLNFISKTRLSETIFIAYYCGLEREVDTESLICVLASQNSITITIIELFRTYCISSPSFNRKQKYVGNRMWWSEKAFSMAAFALVVKGYQDKHGLYKITFVACRSDRHESFVVSSISAKTLG